LRPRERERAVERWDREPLADERREGRCVEEPLDRAEEWCPPDLRRLDELRLFAIFTPSIRRTR